MIYNMYKYLLISKKHIKFYQTISTTHKLKIFELVLSISYIFPFVKYYK